MRRLCPRCGPAWGVRGAPRGRPRFAGIGPGAAAQRRGRSGRQRPQGAAESGEPGERGSPARRPLRAPRTAPAAPAERPSRGTARPRKPAEHLRQRRGGSAPAARCDARPGAARLSAARPAGQRQNSGPVWSTPGRRGRVPALLQPQRSPRAESSAGEERTGQRQPAERERFCPALRSPCAAAQFQPSANPCASPRA